MSIACQQHTPWDSFGFASTIQQRKLDINDKTMSDLATWQSTRNKIWKWFLPAFKHYSHNASEWDFRADEMDYCEAQLRQTWAVQRVSNAYRTINEVVIICGAVPTPHIRRWLVAERRALCNLLALFLSTKNAFLGTQTQKTWRIGAGKWPANEGVNLSTLTANLPLLESRLIPMLKHMRNSHFNGGQLKYYMQL